MMRSSQVHRVLSERDPGGPDKLTVSRSPDDPATVEDGAPDELVVSRALLDRVTAHLRAALPAEGVGLLAIGPPGPHRLVRVTAFYPGTNLDASPTRYTMEPREVIDALSGFERQGWRLGAIVHSHPATPPVPSPTDWREAYYPMALAMIVSFATLIPAIRVWRMDDPSGPIPGRLVVEDDAAGPGAGESRVVEPGPRGGTAST